MYDRNRFGFGFRPNFGQFGRNWETPFGFGFGIGRNKNPVSAANRNTEFKIIRMNSSLSSWYQFGKIVFFQKILVNRMIILHYFILKKCFNVAMTILIALNYCTFFNTVVSVSVSVSAERETFFRFLYRFRPKRKMAVSAIFGFGRNEKKPFGRTLYKFIYYILL